LRVLQEAIPLEGDNLWYAASGFGGGIAGCGWICGALDGAVMALGVAEGQQTAREGRVSDRIKSRVRVLHDEFQERFGSVNCQALSGFILRDPEQYQEFKRSTVKSERCHGYVQFAVDRSLDLLDPDNASAASGGAQSQ
jgi:C_GCAxxG_C_C family probable redox protein